MLFEEEKPKELNCKPKFWRASESVNPFPYGTSEYWFWEVEKKIFTSEDLADTLSDWRAEMYGNAANDKYVADHSIPEADRVVYFGIVTDMETTNVPEDWRGIEWELYFAGRIEGSEKWFRPKFLRQCLGDARSERMLKLAERWSEDDGFLMTLRTVCLYGRYEKAFSGKQLDIARGLSLLSRPDITAALGDCDSTDEEKAFVATVLADAPECRDVDGNVVEGLYDWNLYFGDAERICGDIDLRWGLVRFDKAQLGLWESFSACLEKGEKPKLWLGLFAPVMRGAFDGVEEEKFSFANKDEARALGDQMSESILFRRWFRTISLMWTVEKNIGLKNVFAEEDLKRIHISSTLLDYCAGGFTPGYNIYRYLFGGPNKEAQAWLGLKEDNDN